MRCGTRFIETVAVSATLIVVIVLASGCSPKKSTSSRWETAMSQPAAPQPAPVQPPAAPEASGADSGAGQPQNDVSAEVGNLVARQRRLTNDAFLAGQRCFERGEYASAMGYYAAVLDDPNIRRGPYNDIGSRANVEWRWCINAWLMAYHTRDDDPTAAQAAMQSAEDNCPYGGLAAMHRVIRAELKMRP